MLTFPTLKTGSAVQYPLKQTSTVSTDVLQFLAGDEQRYPTAPALLNTWIIKLSLLDESELRAIEAFFVAAAGSLAVFSFTDPSSGTIHPNCFVAEDSLRESFMANLRAESALVIQEGRV